MTCPECGHPLHIERHEVARVHLTTLYDYTAECTDCGWEDAADRGDYDDAVAIEEDVAADDAIEDALYDR